MKVLSSLKKTVRAMKSNLALNAEMQRLLRDWEEIMSNGKNVNNQFLTFSLNNITKTNYGYSCRIYAPFGLAFEDLDPMKKYIESGLKCIFIYEVPDHKQFAIAKIVKPELVKCNETPFDPYKVKPYELYAGVDVSGKPIVFDLNITPMVLLAGQTRRGKNGSLDHMLCSLIHNCRPREVELYLFQCAKTDLIKYSKSRLTRCCVIGNLTEMNDVLEHLLKETERRGDLLKSMVENFKGDNLLHYNKLNSNSVLPYIYIVIDEFIELMIKSTDKQEQSLKDSILQKLGRIAQWGGSYGVNYIICHQKPEKALMPTFLKNMSSVRICFGFDDDVCSQIVLGNNLAHKLPPRRAYYSSSIGDGLLYTTNLQGKIEPIVKKNSVKNPTYITDELKNLCVVRPIKPRSKAKEKPKNEFVNINGKNVSLNEPVKIPNFEYIPTDLSKVKVIDETNLNIELLKANGSKTSSWRRKSDEKL